MRFLGKKILNKETEQKKRKIFLVKFLASEKLFNNEAAEAERLRKLFVLTKY